MCEQHVIKIQPFHFMCSKCEFMLENQHGYTLNHARKSEWITKMKTSTDLGLKPNWIRSQRSSIKRYPYTVVFICFILYFLIFKNIKSFFFYSPDIYNRRAEPKDNMTL